MHRRPSALAAVLLILLIAASCGEKLPEDPGLLSEDLGIGVLLGTSADTARDLSAPQNVDLLVLTREEFANRNPYSDRESGSELLVVLYSTGSEQIHRNGPKVFDPVVSIKGFLSPEGSPEIELFGTEISALTPEVLTDRLGPPATQVESNDGSTHLSYTFRSKELVQRNLAAMFSFYPEGGCYAFEISLTLLN